MKKLLIFSGLVFLALVKPASASLIQFDIIGKSGPGLLSGNENFQVNGGPFSGAENGTGIFLDDVSKVLTVNFQWVALSGNVLAASLNGPTPSSGSASFLENSGSMIDLDASPAWNPIATAGGVINGTYLMTDPQIAALLGDQTYINVQTQNNIGGEIRGNLVMIPVPEPSSIAICLGLGALGAVYLRRKRS